MVKMVVPDDRRPPGAWVFDDTNRIKSVWGRTQFVFVCFHFCSKRNKLSLSLKLNQSPTRENTSSFQYKYEMLRASSAISVLIHETGSVFEGSNLAKFRR